MKRLSRNTRIAIAVYLFCTACYAAASGGRLRTHSNDNHYVRMADGWLHGRLDLGYLPPAMDDRAQVEFLHLRDGRLLRGAFLSGSNEAFRPLRGPVIEVKPEEIERRETKYYISFAPFPALLMLPIVAIAGLNTNDVIFNVALAGLSPALLFLFLRRLARRGASTRSERDDLWLTAILGLGSVYYYSSVLGQVWYTEHIVSVILVTAFLHASLDAKRPFWAGLALICAFGCRPEVLFAAPFFLWELTRTSAAAETTADIAAHARRAEQNRRIFAPVGSSRAGWLLMPFAAPVRGVRLAGRWLVDGWRRLDKRRLVSGLLRFGVPILILGLAMAYLNYLRFGRPTEFGHTYLQVRWTPRIQKFGLFNYAFLGRNLACMLALTPRILAGPPYVQYSWHGLAIWVTTPPVLYLLWPKVKGPLHWPLWIAVGCVAIPELMYQNSGWVQFGYRFALDYFPMLVALLAIGGRPLDRRFKALILIGIAVNLFGAIVFGRMPQFSFDGYFPPGID